ncbi:MAG: hypothetical protein RIK87_07995 [Fuerstiella sp.]
MAADLVEEWDAVPVDSAVEPFSVQLVEVEQGMEVVRVQVVSVRPDQALGERFSAHPLGQAMLVARVQVVSAPPGQAPAD